MSRRTNLVEALRRGKEQRNRNKLKLSKICADDKFYLVGKKISGSCGVCINRSINPENSNFMKPTPEFAICQNSRTKQSWIWNGKRWAHPPIEDYLFLRMFAVLIRTDPDPAGIIKSIMKAEQIKQADWWQDASA